ncbi:MAG: transporter substrate-binding domain-containing protein [Eubacteriales bacterium]
MKKIISAVLAAAMLAALMCFVFTGCSAKQITLEDIKASGKLVVYTEAGFVPYEFVYNNEIVGVDIEIMKKVAEKLGVTLQIEDVNFNTICAAVQSGKADCGAAGITIRADRTKQVDFSIPYSSTEQYVIVDAGNDSIKNLADLAGKKIGVQEGTTSDFLVEEKIADGSAAGATVTPYTAPAVAAAVIGSKLDAVVTDKLTAQIIASGNSNLKAFPLVNSDGTPVSDVEEYGIAVNKNCKELLEFINGVLTEMLADGSVDGLVEYYSKLATDAGIE